jgi:predicted DCC family thiol-disulfide oxidoreductase YuxK
MTGAIPPRVVLYDGVCGLCNKAVSWMIDRDPRRRLAYAPLQGETADRLRAAHPSIPTNLSTMVYVEDGRVRSHAGAIFAIVRQLDTPWRVFGFLRHVGWLFFPFYWLVARTRYRIFGKTDACRLPTKAERAQLLP